MSLCDELEYARGIDYDANYTGWVKKAEALEAENKKLKEYVQHKPECENNTPIGVCTCGLQSMIKKDIYGNTGTDN